MYRHLSDLLCMTNSGSTQRSFEPEYITTETVRVWFTQFQRMADEDHEVDAYVYQLAYRKITYIVKTNFHWLYGVILTLLTIYVTNIYLIGR